MAAKGDSLPLICGVCLEKYSSPRVLPCLHIYCLTCLQRILDDCGSKDTIACPQCRSQHTVPSLGVRGFVEDTTLVQSEGSEEDSSELACEFCTSGDPAVVYCKQCLQPICQGCKDIHTRVKKYLTHKLVALDDESCDKLPDKASPSNVCFYHPKYDIELYCETCQLVICPKCIPEAHKGHDYEFMDDTKWDGVVLSVKEATNSVCQWQTQNLFTLSFIKNIEAYVLKQQDDLEAQVVASYEKHKKSIEVQKQRALKKLRDIASADTKSLWGTKNDFEVALLQQKSCIEFSERIQRRLDEGQRPYTSMQLLMKQLAEKKLSSTPSSTIDVMAISKSLMKVETPSQVNVGSRVYKERREYIEVKATIDKTEVPANVATYVIIELTSLIPKVALRSWTASIQVSPRKKYSTCTYYTMLMKSQPDTQPSQPSTEPAPSVPVDVYPINDVCLQACIIVLSRGCYVLTLHPDKPDKFFKNIELNLTII